MHCRNLRIKWAFMIALTVTFALFFACIPAHASDDLSPPGDEEAVFVIDDTPVPMAESIWGSEPVSVYITREFYRGANTIEVPMKYFEAIQGSTKSTYDQAIDAFCEA